MTEKMNLFWLWEADSILGNIAVKCICGTTITKGSYDLEEPKPLECPQCKKKWVIKREFTITEVK